MPYSPSRKFIKVKHGRRHPPTHTLGTHTLARTMSTCQVSWHMWHVYKYVCLTVCVCVNRERKFISLQLSTQRNRVLPVVCLSPPLSLAICLSLSLSICLLLLLPLSIRLTIWLANFRFSLPALSMYLSSCQPGFLAAWKISSTHIIFPRGGTCNAAASAAGKKSINLN